MRKSEYKANVAEEGSTDTYGKYVGKESNTFWLTLHPDHDQAELIKRTIALYAQAYRISYQIGQKIAFKNENELFKNAYHTIRAHVPEFAYGFIRSIIIESAFQLIQDEAHGRVLTPAQVDSLMPPVRLRPHESFHRNGNPTFTSELKIFPNGNKDEYRPHVKISLVDARGRPRKCPRQLIPFQIPYITGNISSFEPELIRTLNRCSWKAYIIYDANIADGMYLIKGQYLPGIVRKIYKDYEYNLRNPDPSVIIIHGHELTPERLRLIDPVVP